MTKLFSALKPVSLFSLLAMGACGVLVDNSPGLNDGKEKSELTNSDSDAPVSTQEVKSILAKIDGVPFEVSKSLCMDKDGKITQVSITQGINLVDNNAVISLDKDGKSAKFTTELSIEKAMSENTSNLLQFRSVALLTDLKTIDDKSVNVTATTVESGEKLLTDKEFTSNLKEEDKVPVATILTLSDDGNMLTAMDADTSKSKLDPSCGENAKLVGGILLKKATK